MFISKKVRRSKKKQQETTTETSTENVIHRTQIRHHLPQGRKGTAAAAELGDFCQLQVGAEVAPIVSVPQAPGVGGLVWFGSEREQKMVGKQKSNSKN